MLLRGILNPMLHFNKISHTLWLITLYFGSAIFITDTALASNKSPGTIISDIEAYPFFQHSKLSGSSLSSGQASITLGNPSTISANQLTAILKNWKLPFEVISEAPYIIKTNWLLWHYDENTKKTLSEPQNHFFSINTRDRYRFKFNIEPNNDQTVLKLSQSWREQEIDITPDSAMVWLKWKSEPIDKHAIKAFLQRLQTEFEKIALAENKNQQVVIPQPVITKSDEVTNYQTINQSVTTTWPNLILTLSDKNIPITSADSQRYIVTTNWFQPTSDKPAKFHRFKITLIAGATADESSIFVRHIAAQDKDQNFKKLENSKDKLALETAFLKSLQLNQ